MIIIKLQGGLGNQMFQYAFATILAKLNNSKVIIDISFFESIEKTPGFTPRKFELDIFKNKYIVASNSEIIPFLNLSKINKAKKKLGLNYPKIYKEPSFFFQSDALSIKPPVYLQGYFQSNKYFINNEDLIRGIFTFPEYSLDTTNIKLLSEFKNLNTIAVHIRRGDYVEDKLTQEFHGNCSLNYYLDAIELMASKNKEFTLVFFSDDSNWLKEQFADLPYSKIFVDNNKNENSWKDMLLMSSCKHNIIANSSFSWWGAWLNNNLQKIVIAPKNWFNTNNSDTNNLLPNEWIKL
jgi:hypothetical protein